MDEMCVKIRIYGMSCEDCSSSVKKSLEAQRGVKEAEILLAEGMGVVKIDPNELGPKDILKNEIFSKNSRYRATLI
ncbi:MAG: heavy metal-associated domain-containing protein [Thermoplasmatales archaeon]